MALYDRVIFITFCHRIVIIVSYQRILFIVLYHRIIFDVSYYRGVLVLVNFGCFSLSRFSHFHCNAMRNAIKAHRNLHTNQYNEHTPELYFLFFLSQSHICCFISQSLFVVSYHRVIDLIIVSCHRIVFVISYQRIVFVVLFGTRFFTQALIVARCHKKM